MAWEFDNSQPIYIQLVEMLQFKIISGEISVGEKLASVRELAEEAGVNPNTMQRALVELEREGLVYTQRTSGRFVTEDIEHIKQIKSKYAVSKIKELTSQLLQLGYKEKELVEMIENNLNKTEY